jgi:hypothetical protein
VYVIHALLEASLEQKNFCIMLIYFLRDLPLQWH